LSVASQIFTSDNTNNLNTERKDSVNFYVKQLKFIKYSEFYP
jgi:hypothetical protein